MHYKQASHDASPLASEVGRSEMITHSTLLFLQSDPLFFGWWK